MKTFKFEVTEAYAPCPLTGTTKAKDEAAAIADLKEFYAMELGTVQSEIHVKILN